jgi:hypothetical protein
MAKRVFMDKLNKPTEDAVKIALGETYSFCAEINETASGFFKGWAYSKKSGWLQKTYNEKHSLFYLTPLENEFKISMTIKESERYIFLQDDALKDVNSLFLTAKKFDNDYSIQFSVKNADECEFIKQFIRKLIKIRK